ncbi:hypothetical protein NDU88_000267 [Pleurodeles waltl]|uniref:Uncharacterized protein n=1 Tax=Pleurodeles waltl TaxID=8319 RepID=A0AAV7Q2L5_PLEWA|nr:hypothetical protein NDU88_000267 [Pleurodeles waltl]
MHDPSSARGPPLTGEIRASMQPSEHWNRLHRGNVSLRSRPPPESRIEKIQRGSAGLSLKQAQMREGRPSPTDEARWRM